LAVEELATLMAVQQIGGGIKVEGNPLRGWRVSVEKEIDKKRLDPLACCP
jgi:hypothetical protein